jgi:beta-glucanase (GH16 family)
MAEIIEDRVRESSTSVGTGDFVVSGAAPGFRTFSSVCPIGSTFYAAIVAVDVNNSPTGQWEVGYYTYSAANTITRGIVLSNSLGNTERIDFTAGDKHVFLNLSAYQIKHFAANPSPSGVTPFGQDASLYTALTFSDEFNGSALDANKWNKKLWYDADDPVQNFSVSSGNLNIWPDTGYVARSIDTDGKYYQTYGFFEAEMKLPIGRGVRPVFWLLSHDTDARPEINIMHAYCGAVAEGYANSSYEPIDYNVYTRIPDLTIVGDSRMTPTFSAQLLSSGFHKYGARWDSTGVTYFFDGVQIARHNTTQLSQRMYMILSLDYFRLSGVPNTADTPQGIGNSFAINYVRVWQLV